MCMREIYWDGTPKLYRPLRLNNTLNQFFTMLVSTRTDVILESMDWSKFQELLFSRGHCDMFRRKGRFPLNTGKCVG
jgi:hypothetical protein